MSAYVSNLDHVELHPSGWLLLPSGAQITCMPLVDRSTGLYARLSPITAEQWAASHGVRLPTTEELDQLHARSLHIAPVTMPSGAQLAEAGISARDTRAIDAFRNAHMRSLEWCRLHDDIVAERLAAEHWSGQPVSNAGKHWTAGGGIYGWWLGPTKMIQRASYAHKGSVHTDYATTTHVVRSNEGTQPRRTTLGERGDAVKAWQRYLVSRGHKLTIDGVHGPKTEAASKSCDEVKVEPPRDEMPYIEARNYTRVIRPKVDLVVLHSTENPIKSGTAKAVAQWFASAKAPQASAHYVVGPETVIRCVPEAAVAWAAPGANHTGIQLELVGQASKTEWSRKGLGQADGYDVLERAAELTRAICDRWAIPMERVDAEGLKAGKRGITTHAAVTEAFRKSTHIDPGGVGDAQWPWKLFLNLVCQ